MRSFNEQLNADSYERTDERTRFRNGTKKTKLKTVDGELILKKPDIRSESFETKVFDKHSTEIFLFKNHYPTSTSITFLSCYVF